MQANSYFPVITKPTRVTESSATLIDHIWINNPDTNEQSKMKSGIIVHDLTDHLPIFIIRKANVHPQGYSKIKFRVFSDENISKFKNDIASISTDLYNIINKTDVTINNKVNNYFASTKDRVKIWKSDENPEKPKNNTR